MSECLTYSVEEAARVLGLSRNFAYAAVAKGEIPSLKIGRRIVVPRAAIERMVSQAAEPKAA